MIMGDPLKKIQSVAHNWQEVNNTFCFNSLISTVEINPNTVTKMNLFLLLICTSPLRGLFLKPERMENKGEKCEQSWM